MSESYFLNLVLDGVREERADSRLTFGEYHRLPPNGHGTRPVSTVRAWYTLPGLSSITNPSFDGKRNGGPP